MSAYEVKRHIALKKQKDKAEQLTKELINLTNVMDNDMCDRVGMGIVNALRTEHRTLQQSFIKQLRDALIVYSETSTDARNEQAIEFAKKVKDIEIYFPYV